MRKILVILINFYQKVFSPDHSRWGKRRFPHGYCQYYPSCSEYAKQSIQVHGSFKGLTLGVWRVLRCNPFSKGGMDPVKEVSSSKLQIINKSQ